MCVGGGGGGGGGGGPVPWNLKTIKKEVMDFAISLPILPSTLNTFMTFCIGLERLFS